MNQKKRTLELIGSILAIIFGAIYLLYTLLILTSIDELLDKIERYKSYILPSGGGVTVTGGEPLLQVKFLITLQWGRLFQ